MPMDEREALRHRFAWKRSVFESREGRETGERLNVHGPSKVSRTVNVFSPMNENGENGCILTTHTLIVNPVSGADRAPSRGKGSSLNLFIRIPAALSRCNRADRDDAISQLAPRAKTPPPDRPLRHRDDRIPFPLAPFRSVSFRFEPLPPFSPRLPSFSLLRCRAHAHCLRFFVRPSFRPRSIRGSAHAYARAP